jgi:hypothetical protein
MTTTIRCSLSEMATRVTRALQGVRESHEDVDAWHAPSECHGLVARSNARDMARLFRESGWTPEEFEREVEARTSSRWFYVSGFGEAISMASEGLERERTERRREIQREHNWLCHPNGERCPDGCDAAPDPERLAIYQEDQR